MSFLMRSMACLLYTSSSNAKLRARVEVVHPYLALMGLYFGGFAGMYLSLIHI